MLTEPFPLSTTGEREPLRNQNATTDSRKDDFMPFCSCKNVKASSQMMRRAKGGAVSMGKDTACHRESGAAEVMEQQHPSLNHLQQFLRCGFFSPPFQILPLGTEWEHWKCEPNSLPEAAETCLQLLSYLHFSNGFISKSFYKLAQGLQAGNTKISWTEMKSPPKP